ncbi:hypothetical protein [Streptococcus oriscaviae]|uniref:Uncharacterized protein n=1 Tax=Streptococcus oriscaviae TaxID=2781599 RepID=A0ABX7YM35_9STRE|nr:hypothetical protein [Streptococcus oriscaviae]QUE54717.1 hypothetical protein INT76_02185 [Streptococcus oriscaviae]
MRKQSILNHLLVSTAVLGTILIYQTPTVQAETISETSPSSLETNQSIASNSEAINTTDGALSEKTLAVENPVNQELSPENQIPTTTPSQLVSEASSSSEIDGNKTVTSTSDNAGTSSTEATAPVASGQTNVAETTLTPTESATPTTAAHQTEAAVTPAEQISPVTDTKTEEIQNTNVWEKSVSISREQPTSNTVKWTVTFDSTNWGLTPDSVGAFYFFTPKNAEITSIVDNSTNQELVHQFSTEGLYKAYDENHPTDGLNQQWGWSVENITSRDPRLDQWKKAGLFSRVFVLNERKDTGKVTFTITATVPDDVQQAFPFVAVMKRYKKIALIESTALAATNFEKNPKVTLKPLFPETPTPPKTGGITISPLKPQVPKEKPTEQIQVTFKEGKGGENNPSTFTHYIYGGQIIKMVNPEPL